MKKLIPIILFLSLIFGTFFYLSNISFQLDAFKWKSWAVEVLIMLVISALSGFVVYRHGKRWKKKNK